MYFGMFSTVPICFEHRQHGLVGAAMRRAPQRRHAGRDRGIGIGAGAAGQAHGGGAGVLLMVRVQDEQQVERLGGHRIDVIRLAGHGEEHVQHVGAVAQVVARIDERLAQ